MTFGPDIHVGSKDGQGAGDRDTPHLWGNPMACLTWHEQLHVLIMRGYAKDTRAGERGLAADGDITLEKGTSSPHATNLV